MSARSYSFSPSTIPLGIGYYTVPEAARLLAIPAINIRRWLAGYHYSGAGVRYGQPPLWPAAAVDTAAADQR